MAGARATVRCASLRADGRVLVTLDKDFGELAILHGVAHAGIVRLVGLVPGSRARRSGDPPDLRKRTSRPRVSGSPARAPRPDLPWIPGHAVMPMS